MTALATQSRRLVERIRGINPHAIDGFLALAFTAVALWTVAARVDEDDVYRNDDALGIVLLLLQTLPLAVRSVSPLGSLAVSVAAISFYMASGYEGVAAGTFSALVILYSVASLADTRQSIIGLLLAVVGITVYFATDRGDPGLVAAVSTYATYAAAWGVGMYLRSRREYTSIVEERAELLESEREVRARQAVADERVRIARELHDMVGHAMNLIVIQAGGAQRVFASNPDVARDSLASIESTGRQALAEMERTLGILRAAEEGDDGLSPQPGLEQVNKLAEQVTQAGVPVEVTIEGVPPALLPASLNLSAYRIVQEALTNVLKHAGPARARVAIRYASDRLELEITDDGRGMSERDDAEGRRGLIGMRERVALFGGQLDAGPEPEGGFRVSARLPIDHSKS
jgi:signal transduction histidine kinase